MCRAQQVSQEVFTFINSLGSQADIYNTIEDAGHLLALQIIARKRSGTDIQWRQMPY